MEFTYVPSGFRAGSIATGLGLLAVLACVAWPRPVGAADPSHGPTAWPAWWPIAFGALLAASILGSAIRVGPGGVSLHPRWDGSLHRFTWSADTDTIRTMGKAHGR